MAELSLTKWMDGAFEYFAKESGIPASELSTKWGAETFGVAIEGVSDLLLTPMSTKILSTAIGVPAWLIAIWGKSVVPSKRTRDELFVLGNHLISRIIDPKPSDILELRANIDKLVAGLKLGDVSRVTDAFLRSPEELKRMLGALRVPGIPTALPAAPPTPPPTAKPGIPTPAPPVKRIYA